MLCCEEGYFCLNNDNNNNLWGLAQFCNLYRKVELVVAKRIRRRRWPLQEAEELE